MKPNPPTRLDIATRILRLENLRHNARLTAQERDDLITIIVELHRLHLAVSNQKAKLDKHARKARQQRHQGEARQ